MSSYRGADRCFYVGMNPDRYIFAFPYGHKVEPNLQVCYRHELRIALEPARLDKSPYSEDALLNESIILDLARDVATDGVHVEIPMRTKISPNVGSGKYTSHVPLLVYLLVYGGQGFPLTRMDADKIRERLEETIQTQLGFQIVKPGRLVSKPFPYPALGRLIRDYST